MEPALGVDGAVDVVSPVQSSVLSLLMETVSELSVSSTCFSLHTTLSGLKQRLRRPSAGLCVCVRVCACVRVCVRAYVTLFICVFIRSK